MLAIAILCCLAAVSSASYLPKSGRWPPTCNDCVFDTNGIGYIPHHFCRNFIQCEPIGNGQFKQHVRCCADDTVWDQRVLTCVEHIPTGYICQYPGIDRTNCNATAIHKPNCTYTPDPNSTLHFYNHGIRQICAPGTHWDQDNCTCIHGGPNPCIPDLLVDFQFNAGPDQWIDSSCNKIPCNPHGNAHVVGSSMVANGRGDYCEFNLLNNIFIDNPELHEFTIEIRFRQTMFGSTQLFEGLFGNGNCNYSATVSMGTENNAGTPSGNGEIETVGTGMVFGPPINYTPGAWTCFAMVYNANTGEADYWVNGAPVILGVASGEIDNTQVASTIGMGRRFHNNWCEPIFYHGEIDRVRIWKIARNPPNC